MYKTMTYEDRKKIEQLYNEGVKVTLIASIINVHRTTIYKELKRGQDKNGHYHANLAQKSLFTPRNENK